MPTTWDQRAATGPTEEIVVTCVEHGLDKTVDSLSYAANLVNYHNREYHPRAERIGVGTILADPHCGAAPEPVYDISAAAQAMLRTQTFFYDSEYKHGAVAVWEALTGLTGRAAIEKATTLADAHVVAHRPTF